MNATHLQALLTARQRRIDVVLRRCLPREDTPRPLYEALCYAVLKGGKRLRPQLAYAAAEAVGGFHGAADLPACAVELVHAYSLVHDDLPAMDDDVLRRGQPTCHVAFDEATAILAGDALQAQAFELLACSPLLACGHTTRLRMVTELARACGRHGMVGGQAIDIAATGNGKRLTEAQLSDMHARKTGALIEAAVVLGALSTNLASAAQLTALRACARLAGLAFQIRDDILDVEASSLVIGKQQGRDAALNKATYTTLLGLDGARQRLTDCANQAVTALSDFGPEADTLRALVQHLASRSS